ncbi:UNVERIFIED_CONTAM: RNA processing protein [Siphonaria sp. JEL0065]|nr:RNA processing protein [Siphonaria sp. JEL0065]
MLPLSLLNTAKGHPILVELKTGLTYNGHLDSCDNWMNINLHEVICTSADGEKFWRLAEVYIRGNTIKYLRLPDEIIDKVREDREFRERREAMSGNGGRGGGRGGYNNRGGNRGGRGGFGNNRGGRGGHGGGSGQSGGQKQQ